MLYLYGSGGRARWRQRVRASASGALEEPDGIRVKSVAIIKDPDSEY
jgi:hypothetical protein